MRTLAILACLGIFLTSSVVVAQVVVQPVAVGAASTPATEDRKTVCNVEEPTGTLTVLPGTGGCATGTLGTAPVQCTLYYDTQWDCTTVLKASLSVSAPACGSLSHIGITEPWGGGYVEEFRSAGLSRCVTEDLLASSPTLRWEVPYGISALQGNGYAGGWFKLTGKVCVSDASDRLPARCRMVDHYFYMPPPPEGGAQSASAPDFVAGARGAIDNKLSGLPVDPSTLPPGTCDETLVSDEGAFGVYHVVCPT